MLKALSRAAVAAIALTLTASLAPAEPIKHYAQSLVGKVKHGPDFKHFDWVNPSAPKGGTVRLFAQGSFDSLNLFATTQGNAAAGLTLIYDSLFESSPDEPTAHYGLIAEYATHPDDYASVTIRLRDGAKFHDGKPVTPEDVIFSMEEIKKADPQRRLYYANVVKGEKTGDRDVTFTFDSKGNRELPHIVGELPIIPKHYWTAKGANGEPRDLSKSTLEIPVGSGAYKVKSVDPTRGITYERVADYWAKDLPVNVGQNNFDEIQFTYYRDRVPAFEAFKSGSIDYWAENRASSWAAQYDFDAIKKGMVKKDLLPTERLASMQVLAFNTRRPKFADLRVRKAFNLAYNFEEANKKFFYESYTRIGSFFDGSELKATGVPQGRELEILNEIKPTVPADSLPPEVFTVEYKNPVNTPQTRRANLAEASKLLTEAGWTNKGGTLMNAAGEPFTVEFLLEGEVFQNIILAYIEDLKLLGIKASVRAVDASQYKRRTDDRDFDIIVDNMSQSISPGNEQRDFWSSAAADGMGSRNSVGIKNPAIDKIVDKIVFAKDRDELIAAARTLDRVLLWNWYVVPTWHLPAERVAYWDKFGRPAKLPSQTSSFLRVWWVDPAKDAALTAARAK